MLAGQSSLRAHPRTRAVKSVKLKKLLKYKGQLVGQAQELIKYKGGQVS